MLQMSPRSDLRTGQADDDGLYCRGCRALVTRGRWRHAWDGRVRHRCINPAGLVFLVTCFRRAPGAVAVGEAVARDTWFPPHAWQIAVCRSCAGHVGWCYPEGGFWGLIDDRLGPPGGGRD